jgi:hypothetical protein
VVTNEKPTPASISSGSKRIRRSLIGVLVFIDLVLGCLWYIGLFGGNIHAVVPGKVYRSAQLTGRNLDELLTRDHIRSELNLRGGNAANTWYRNELDECRSHGVDHYDIDMSARRFPTPRQLRRIFDVFDHARYPIVYHCKAGSDRTGLVSTIYLNVYQHEPIEKAYAAGLTWRYGHFSFGETHAMDDFVHLYMRTSGGEPLRQWSVDKYPALYAGLPGVDKNANTRNE